MSKSQEIVQLAEQARELVDNLKSLKERAGQYAQAKEELAVTRRELGKLIDETSRQAGVSHQILEKLDKISAGSMLDQLSSIHSTQNILQMESREWNAAAKSQLERVEAAQKTNRLLAITILVIVLVTLALTFRAR